MESNSRTVFSSRISCNNTVGVCFEPFVSVGHTLSHSVALKRNVLKPLPDPINEIPTYNLTLYWNRPIREA